MKPRVNSDKAAPGVYQAMEALDQYLGGCGLEESLLHLVRLRASIAARLVPGAYRPAVVAS
jgi:hypothetical protein